VKIGVPKEIKNHEYRVGLTPASVREVVAHGHELMVEQAGAGIGAADADYQAPAQPSPALPPRCSRRRADRQGQGAAGRRARMLRDGQVLFTYLHLAPDPVQARELIGQRRGPASPTRR
jgi:alanine dehydrogenase